jgi:hypothetical protein
MRKNASFISNYSCQYVVVYSSALFSAEKRQLCRQVTPALRLGLRAQRHIFISAGCIMTFILCFLTTDP